MYIKHFKIINSVVLIDLFTNEYSMIYIKEKESQSYERGERIKCQERIRRQTLTNSVFYIPRLIRRPDITRFVFMDSMTRVMMREHRAGRRPLSRVFKSFPSLLPNYFQKLLCKCILSMCKKQVFMVSTDR